MSSRDRMSILQMALLPSFGWQLVRVPCVSPKHPDPPFSKEALQIPTSKHCVYLSDLLDLVWDILQSP